MADNIFLKRLRTIPINNQSGRVVVKFYWWPLIISLAISLILTILLNILF